MTFRTKRIYEPASVDDGLRVLVDRVWPQGISRYDAMIDLWDKDVAPTAELRKWFGHKPEHWEEFQRRYRAEMAHNAAIAELRNRGHEQVVTLLYAARDLEHNHARILAAVLDRGRKAPVKTQKTEAIETSSPVCFARDSDPAYMGYLPPHELISTLNELLEAERAGARITLTFARQARDGTTKNLMETIHQGHTKWCAFLRRAVHALGGEPSRKAAALYGKPPSVPGPRNRLAMLMRGQEWTIEKLRETLPKIGDDGVYRDLTAMLKAHKSNIRLIAASAPAEDSREDRLYVRRSPVL